jgi:hypothetical protein
MSSLRRGARALRGQLAYHLEEKRREKDTRMPMPPVVSSVDLTGLDRVAPATRGWLQISRKAIAYRSDECDVSNGEELSQTAAQR